MSDQETGATPDPSNQPEGASGGPPAEGSPEEHQQGEAIEGGSYSVGGVGQPAPQTSDEEGDEDEEKSE